MDLFEETLAEVKAWMVSVMCCGAIRRAPRSWRPREGQAQGSANRRRGGQRLFDEYPREAVKTQIARLKVKSKTLHLDKFVAVDEQERRVVVMVGEVAFAEVARLDGCYALRTDLLKTVVDK